MIDITAAEFDKMSFDLGLEVLSQSPEKIDTVVYMPRGAFRVADIVSRVLQLEALDVEALSITTRDILHNICNPRFGQMPREESVNGKNILLVDDVWDSGLTIVTAQDLLMGFCSMGDTNYKAASVRTAVPVFKPDANSYHDRRPDHYILTVNGGGNNAWVNFPGEKLAGN